jgi:hypothetical protein
MTGKLKKYSGTVRFSALEGGFWQLDGDDGKRYQLVGNIKGLKDGLKVDLEGELQQRRMSFAMIGPVLHVTKVLGTTS